MCISTEKVHGSPTAGHATKPVTTGPTAFVATA
jgi:hypothetical protein